MIFKRGYLKNRTLMTKLLLSYILLTILPTSFLGYAAYVTYTDGMERQAAEYVPKILQQANQNIDSRINEIKGLTESIYANPNVVEILRNKASQTKSEGLQEQFAVERYLTNTYLNGGNSDLLGVFLFTNNRTYTASTTGYEGFADGEENTVTQDQTLTAGEEILLPAETSLRFENNQPFILIGKSIRDVENQSSLGTMYFAVDLTFINNIFSSLTTEENTYITLMNEQGIIINHTDDEKIGEMQPNFEAYPITNGSFQYQNELMSIHRSPSTGWSLVYDISVHQLVSSQNRVRNISILLFVIACIISISISVLLAWSVSKPVRRLTAKMKQVETGNFNVNIPVRNDDEIGRLSAGFNAMMSEIRRLINTNYKLTLSQKEAELYALQSQINPHFIYNTLETINFAVEEEDSEAVISIISGLGRMLRYSLNNEQKLVALSDEIRHISDYLQIQQFRFGSKLHYEMQIEPELHHCRLPKFILQPLVENSVKYGLDHLGKIHIKVKAETEDDILLITISDSGPGITAADFQRIEKEMAAEGLDRRAEHFGINNVNSRIIMHFGDAYGLKLHPDFEADGFKLFISLPILAEQNKERGTIG